MKCLGRCLLGLIAILATLALFFACALVLATSWLVRSDAPAKADAIVVLAGDARRARHAADLYRQGLAPHVLVSRPARTPRERMLDDMGVVLPRNEEVDAMVLRRAGLPAERIEFFGEDSVSTFDEALILERRYTGKSPTLLVVTSPYHTRRAGIILGNTMPAARILMVPTAYEDFPERWWTSQDAARDLLLELAKLAYYGVGGRFVSARP